MNRARASRSGSAPPGCPWSLCRAFVLFAVLAPAGGLRAEEPRPEGFLRRYRDALRTLEAAHARIRVEGTLAVETLDTSGSGDPPRERRGEVSYAASGGRERFVRVYEEPKYVELVHVIGTGRDFLLRRLSPDADYAISEIGVEKLSGLSSVEMFKSGIVNSASSVSHASIRRIVESPRFEVRGLARSDRDGSPLIRVDFAYRFQPSDPEQFNLSGWLLLDPEHELAIRAYDVRSDVPSKPLAAQSARGTVRYASRASGLALPIEVDYTIRSVSTATEDRYHFVADRSTGDPGPDRLFTLAAYGLGDVVDRPPGRPRNTVAYWAFGVAVLAIVAGLILRRLGRAD